MREAREEAGKPVLEDDGFPQTQESPGKVDQCRRAGQCGPDGLGQGMGLRVRGGGQVTLAFTFQKI